MNSHKYLPVPRNHEIGWIVIGGEKDEGVLRERLDAGLNSFCGEQGLLKEMRTAGGLGFGLWKPQNPLRLTTWSLFEEGGKTCFIEGVFYDEYCSHRAANGEDQELARIFLREFDKTGGKAIERLNGSFSGFVFDHNTGRLVTFVDRLGVHSLFWSYENGRVIVSSNLAAFRGLRGLSLDQSAAFQFLTVGFPIGERTLLQGVMIQLPCTMNIYDRSSRRSVRYWDIPKRAEKMSLEECVEVMSQSVEEHVERVYERTRGKMGLGISGGHDSRVILSALAYKKAPFLPVRWKDDDFNDSVASTLCSLVKKEPLTIENVSAAEMEEMRQSIFAYSDGNYLYAYGFIRLARACCDQGIDCLLLGFSGDRISGSFFVPAPHYLRSIDQLAVCSLKAQMELLSFRDARALLGNTRDDLSEEARTEWLHSFFRESGHEHLPDVAMWQAFANRNLKRIRFAMMPARQYVQPVFPYLDSKVLAAYMSMPMRFLNNQKAHCHAGFHRFNAFGNYQACGYPVSLRTEARFPSGIYFLRLSRSKLDGLVSLLKSSRYKGDWSKAHYDICDEILKSPLFDAAFFKRLFSEKHISPKELYKIHTLARFYDFYVCGDDSYLPPRFLRG